MAGEIPVALLAGFLSFLAPCVLPLVPGYLSAVSAVSADELGRPGTARRVVVSSLPFVLGFTAFFVLLGVLFGVVYLVPLLGDVWAGLLFPLLLLAGVVMAILLVGLVGWPMIHVTLSAEGSDSFDALSRSYSYVLQNPWNYIWYCAVAVVYGAVVVFFVGFMGSLTVYLGKWAMTQTPGTEYFNRDPAYL